MGLVNTHQTCVYLRQSMSFTRTFTGRMTQICALVSCIKILACTGATQYPFTRTFGLLGSALTTDTTLRTTSLRKLQQQGALRQQLPGSGVKKPYYVIQRHISVINASALMDAYIRRHNEAPCLPPLSHCVYMWRELYSKRESEVVKVENGLNHDLLYIPLTNINHLQTAGAQSGICPNQGPKPLWGPSPHSPPEYAFYEQNTHFYQIYIIHSLDKFLS